MTPQKLAFVVTTPPHINLTVSSIEMITAALENDIEVVGVFFYQSGVLNAASYVSIPNDEFQAGKKWDDLTKLYQLPLHVCSTAAEKHGLSDELKTGSNIRESFTISGLGTLVELTATADKVIQL